MRKWMLVLIVACTDPAHVYDANGKEFDCAGKPWDQCIAVHCLKGYETDECAAKGIVLVPGGENL